MISFSSIIMKRFVYLIALIAILLSCEDEPLDPYKMEASGSLPVLYINTENNSPIISKDKEDYLHANWWLDSRGISGYESLGSPEEPLGLVIKGRGNFTWEQFEKKSYRIKLEKNEKLIGMKKNKHFCLLAHADDHLAKLKNTIGFEISRRIGLAYTPAQEPVELVINGEYLGLYFITEKPRVGKNRVNITEQSDYETDINSITGGWLLELNSFEGTMFYVQEHTNQPYSWEDMICFESKSPEVLSSAQHDYMNQFLIATNTAIYCTDKSSMEWEKYIDVDTLAMYYIVGEIMDDLEYFAGSVFVYKHRGENTKIVFGPVWDFGNSFQRWAIYNDTQFNKYIYEKPTVFKNRWIEEIAKFPRFQQAVKKQWKKFYQSGFNGLNLDAYIDSCTSRIERAFNKDARRWPQYNDNSIRKERDNFKKFINRKIDWLNKQWGETN